MARRGAGMCGPGWMTPLQVVESEGEPTRVPQAPPNPKAPLPPTSNMPYYVDLWRWLAALSTESGQGPSKDLSPRKIKGGQGVCHTKANSEGQARSRAPRFTLRRPSDRRRAPEEDVSGPSDVLAAGESS